MSEAKNTAERRLSDQIREVKNAIADRDDVVVELREAQKMRVELLASELAPIFAEVPAEVDLFDFTVSSGLQPRLWIDSVSHVAMARDRRTYRFVKDTRLGRVVLAESPDVKIVADRVALYVAERLVERDRAVDGAAEPVFITDKPARFDPFALEFASLQAWAVIGIFLSGAACGIALTAFLLWGRFAAS